MFNKCNSLNTYFQHVHGIEIMLVCIHYRYSCGCFSLDVQLYLFILLLTFSFWYACLFRRNELWYDAVHPSVNSVYNTVYPKKYAHGFCFAVLCCGYTLTDFPISIRLTSLALWQSNDCPSASKANLMNMDKYFMWIHYERLRNPNKAKHNKTVCIFLGIYRNSKYFSESFHWWTKGILGYICRCCCKPAS